MNADSPVNSRYSPTRTARDVEEMSRDGNRYAMVDAGSDGC